MSDPYDEIPLPSLPVLSEEESAKQLRDDICRGYRERAVAEMRRADKAEAELVDERQKREQAERALAELREAANKLEPICGAWEARCLCCGAEASHGDVIHKETCITRIAKRIDAGSNWVPADRFKEVVEALEAIRDKADPYTHQIHWCRETAREALARAK